MVVNIQSEEGGRGGGTSPDWGSLDNPVGGGGGGGGGQTAGQPDNPQKNPAAAPLQNQNKPFIAMKVTGTVKWFNVKSGYGFINRKDTGEDVFVHQSAIAKNNPKKAVRSVGDGEIVVFDVVAGEKGNEAANVTGLDGVPVKGSPYAADKRRGIRPSWWFPSQRSRGPRKQQGKDGEEGEETARDDSKPRRFRNRRYLGGGGGGGGEGGGGGGYYNRRQQNAGDKNGEKEGGDAEDGGHEEDGRGGGGERGGPRGGRGGGRGPPRRYRYVNYRGARQGGPPKPRGTPQQDGGLSDGGGGGGGSVKDGSGGDEGGNGGAERSRTRGRGGGGGGGGNRGRPRYRRPQRSLSQADKPAKETSQEVQNTTDESAA